jgi:hypothetical protein
MKPSLPPNRRILLVDDNLAIHDDSQARPPGRLDRRQGK